MMKKEENKWYCPLKPNLKCKLQCCEQNIHLNNDFTKQVNRFKVEMTNFHFYFPLL